MDKFLEFLTAFQAEGKTLSAEEIGKITTTLRNSAVTQPIYQSIFDRGHGEATTTHQRKITELEGQITALTGEKEALQKKYNDLEGKTPDAQKIREEMQGEITKKEQEIKDLKAAHSTERVTWHRESARQKFVLKLTEKGVDPEWAEYLSNKPENLARLKVTPGEEGKVNVEVLKAGSESIALQGDDPMDMFAAEVRQTVKPKYIVSNAEGGSGARGGSEGGGGNKSHYDTIRERAEKERASERPEGFKSGAERLGATNRNQPA